MNFNSAFVQFLLDYEGRQSDSNVNSFLNKWPTYAERIRSICVADRAEFHSGWNQEINDLLQLLKLFPAKVKRGTNKLHYEPILDVIDKLIVFALVRSIDVKMSNNVRRTY